MKIIVVIPAYNVGKKIINVFESLKKLGDYYDEIIIINDNSIDNTKKYLKTIQMDWNLKKPLHIYHHKKNLGYGGVQKNLYNLFKKLNGDIAVLIHGDNQYSPELLKIISKPILSGNYDIVLGSRFYKNRKYYEEMPWFKIIGNKFLTLIENLILRSNLTEFHTGLRAYSKNFLNQINYESFRNEFIFDSEILFKAITHNFRIKEIPIYAKYEENESNLNPLVYGLRILLLCVSYLYKLIFKRRR